MLRRLRAILEFQIHATDGPLGNLRDFHFDADTGRLKYGVATLGFHYPWHSILIPAAELGPPEGATCSVRVQKTCAQLRRYPPVSADPPIYYQIQQQAANFFAWAAQWTPFSGQPEPDPVFRPIPGSTRQSLRHLLGSHIETTDGDAGLLYDLFIDPDTLCIRAIGTHAGEGKRVLVLTEFIRSISCDRRVILLEIDRAGLVSAPEFDPLRFDDFGLEERLKAHYTRTLQHV
ncbi:MAG: hypothetical protein NTZ09_01645 [Candidatus Hydrogenedentes bacterium]|nr:hypothetical protein [Candidatus Hydrogenedentota bacterium]